MTTKGVIAEHKEVSEVFEIKNQNFADDEEANIPIAKRDPTKKTRETEAAKTKIQNYIVDEKCNRSSEYMEQFTEDEVNILKEMLIIFDGSGDYKLQEDELYMMLQLLGAEPTRHDVRRIMRNIDKSNTGAVDFEEFKSWLAQDSHKRKLLLQKHDVMKKVDGKLSQILKLDKSEIEVLETLEKGQPSIKNIEIPLADQEIENADKLQDTKREDVVRIFLSKKKSSDSFEFSILLVVVILVFFPDAWEYSNLPEDQDIIRNVVILFCIACFIYEVVVKYIEDVRYRFSAFMWMDVVGVLVLFTDLTWILHHLTGVGHSAAVLRATRATKLGLRSKELLKVLTVLLHLVHHIFIFDHSGKVHASDNGNKEVTSSKEKGDIESASNNGNKESHNSFLVSRIGSFAKLPSIAVEQPQQVTLPKRTNFISVAVKDVGITIAVATRVAMTVMVLVIIVPFLVFVEPDTGGDAWLDSSIILAQSETTNEVAVLKFAHGVEHFFKKKDTKLHSLRIESPYLPEAFEREYHTRAVLREESILELSAGFSMLNSDIVKHGLNHTVVKCMSCSTHFESVIELDVTHEVQMHALYSMMISLLVLLVLIGSTVTFVHVVHSLPMEELVNFCRSLALQLDAKIPVKLY